jgi:hypothetical protein
MKPEKDVSIMIELLPDGWHVVVHVDGALVERSPPLSDRDTARKAAEIVSERFEAKFSRAGGGKWRRYR